MEPVPVPGLVLLALIPSLGGALVCLAADLTIDVLVVALPFYALLFLVTDLTTK